MIKGLGDIRKFVESGRTKGFLAFLKEVILYGFMTFITVIVLNPDIIYQNLKERQEREHTARLEKRLVKEANALGIGPMGLGGKTTVLGVKIGSRPRVPASFFVTVAYLCWAARRQTMRFGGGQTK